MSEPNERVVSVNQATPANRAGGYWRQPGGNDATVKPGSAPRWRGGESVPQ